jgi:hypothetical protein
VAASTAGAQEVRLPLERYHELERQARASETVVVPAAPFALPRAELDLEVGATRALVTVQLDLVVLAEGWHRLSLPMLGRWVGAELGALEGRLEGLEGQSALLFRGPGAHRVTLTAVTPVAEELRFGRRSYTVEVAGPPAAAVLGQVRSALDVAVLEAGAGAIVLGDGTLTGSPRGATARFATQPGSPVSLALRAAAASPVEAGEVRFESTVATLIRARPTRLIATDRILLAVASGALSDVQVEMPAGSRVGGAGGEGLAGWRIDGAAPGEPTRLRLSFDPEVRREVTVVIERELVAADPSRRVEIAGEVPRIAGAGRQRSVAAIEVLADGIATRIDGGAGARPLEAGLVPEPVLAGLPPAARRSALLLPPDGAAPRWEVEWPDDTEVLAASIDRLRVEWLLGVSGRSALRLHAEVRSRGSEMLELELPSSFELSAARLDGRDLHPGRRAEAIAVPLIADGATHHLVLEGLAQTPPPAAGGVLELWVPAASAPISQVEVRALLDGRFSYRLRDAARYEGPTPRGPAPAPGPWSEPFVAPAGFAEVTVRWSALSPRPGPLRFDVEAGTVESSWY